MDIIQTTLGVQGHIAQGLQNGIYERIGGVVRNADSKQVVGWLREVNETGEPVVSQVLSLSSVAATTSTLNLAVSSMGFAVVLYRLRSIEKQLDSSLKILEAIGNKIDISFYANFRSAIDLAMNAFTMTKSETRRASAMQAINRFLEAKHHYSPLVDIEIANGSPLAEKYLSTLTLAYTAEARCYLELEELDTACRCMQESISELRPRYRQHINTLLTPNPAVYLHPNLTGQINLPRLTRVYQWLEPGITEIEVFEKQRENLFRLAQNPKDWIDSLPQAIYVPQKSRTSLADYVKQPQKIAKMISSIPLGITKQKENLKTGSDENTETENPLLTAMNLMESMIEDSNRMEMYQSEVETIRQLGASFQEWRTLSPSSRANGDKSNLMYISLQE